jgi:DNA-binding Xre family transcriptional regulator
MLKVNGTKVEILLGEKHLTAQEVTKKAGVTTMSMVKARRGEYMQPRTIAKIADALCVQVRDLV